MVHLGEGEFLTALPLSLICALDSLERETKNMGPEKDLKMRVSIMLLQMQDLISLIGKLKRNFLKSQVQE